MKQRRRLPRILSAARPAEQNRLSELSGPDYDQPLCLPLENSRQQRSSTAERLPGSEPRWALRLGKESGSPCQKRLRLKGDTLEFLFPGRNSSHRSPSEKEKAALVSDSTWTTHAEETEKPLTTGQP